MEINTYPCTLVEFLLLGRLGLLEIGLSQSEVLKQFGEPKRYLPGLNGHDFRQSVQWLYKTLGLRWDMHRRRLQEIVLHPLSDGTLPEPLQAVGFYPERHILLEEFEIYLKLENIAYEIENVRYPARGSVSSFRVHFNRHTFAQFHVYGGGSHLVSITCYHPLMGLYTEDLLRQTRR